MLSKIQEFAALVADIKGKPKAPVEVPPDKVFLTQYQERALLQIARGGWVLPSDLDMCEAIDAMRLMNLIIPDPVEWYVCTPTGRSVCARYLLRRRRERQEHRLFLRRTR